MFRKSKWLVFIPIVLLCMACVLESSTQTRTYTLSFDLNGGSGPAPHSISGLKSGDRVYLPFGTGLFNAKELLNNNLRNK